MSSGEVFAHYLFLGKVSNDRRRADVTPTSGSSIVLRPSESTKTPSVEDFLRVMSDWFCKLIQIGHAADVMNCMETAIEVFYEWKEDILKCTADLFLRNENFDIALILKKRIASECLIDDLDLVEDIEQICNKCIPRWHFRMLNDAKRNQFFFTAIEKAIINGYKDIIDIGCGTGILSLFAAGSGADNVLGFEVSQTMCEIGNRVICANGFQRKISLFNEMSTNIMRKDERRRSELAVMEIFDSGLLGEGVLTTLQHAWKELLVHSKLPDNHSPGIVKSRVIPSSARIYVLLIESKEIRKHARSKSRVLDINFNGVLVLGRRDPEDTSEQPYTTENLKYIKDGYKPLSNPVKLLEVDFNNPQELSRLSAKSFSTSISLNETGRLDGIVVWFELQLDEDLILSTSPDAGSCWEQAIYPIENRRHEDFSGVMAIEGSVLELNAFCNQKYLEIFTTNVHASGCLVSKGIVSSATETTVSKTLHDFKLNSAELQEPDNRKSTERFMCEEACNESDFVCGRCTKFSKDIDKTDRYLNEKLGDVSTEHLTDPTNEAAQVKSMEELQFDRNKDHVDCYCSLGPELSNSSRTRIDACEILVGGKACTDNRGRDEASNHSSDVKCISVDRRKVARLNDEIYWHHYRNSISVAMKDKMKANKNVEIKILCLSGELSLIPLLIPRTGNASIDVPIRSLESMVLLENAAEENGIELHRHNFLEHSLPEIAAFGKEYDLIILEIVEENGLLSQRLFDDIVLIRTFLLKKDGILIPEKFSVHGCILDSPMIEKDNFVNGNETTLGYEIGEFINQYRVFTHPDVDMLNLPCTRLTSDFEIIQVELTEGKTDEDILLMKRPRTVCHDILVAENGKTSAVGYWFDVSLHRNIVLSTAAGLETHWHQSCAIFKEQKLIKSGKQVSLKAVMNRGNLHIVGIDDT